MKALFQSLYSLMVPLLIKQNSSAVSPFQYRTSCFSSLIEFRTGRIFHKNSPSVMFLKKPIFPIISPYVILRISSLSDGGKVWIRICSSSLLKSDQQLFSMYCLILLVIENGILALLERSWKFYTLFWTVCSSCEVEVTMVEKLPMMKEQKPTPTNIQTNESNSSSLVKALTSPQPTVVIVQQAQCIAQIY